MRFFSLTAIPACAGPARARPDRAARVRACLGFTSVMFSLTAIPTFGGACAGAPFRAAAIRPCLGCASVAGVMLKRFAIYHRLPRIARLAIEARPKGRARAGPRRSRGIAVSEINVSEIAHGI